jgi:uncharacterized membrane protein YqjE
MSDQDGLLRNFSALLAANLAYLRARLQLAGLEGREAGVHYVVILALALAALVTVVFGYFFLIIAAVFLVALAFGGGNAWIWVTLGAAILHFLLAGLLLLVAKAKLTQPMFAATLDEFKKDQQWLKNSANPN